MMQLLFLYFLVISVTYGLPALFLWLLFDLSLLQIAALSGLIGTVVITVLSVLEAPVFMLPEKRRKTRGKGKAEVRS